MDFMTGLKRTNYCGDFRMQDVGKEVVVAGWVQRQRDLGALIFIDLRDRSGIVQLAFDEGCDKEVFDKAFAARSEYVLMARGACSRDEPQPKFAPPTIMSPFFTLFTKSLSISSMQ